MSSDPYWDDLRTPASAINPPGAVEDPDLDSLTGTWLFDAASTETLAVAVQLPHAWMVGTALHPHVHWMKTTSAAGDVLWRMQYKWAPIGEVMDASWTELDVTSTVAGTPDNDTADEHLISAWEHIETFGKGISDMLLIRFGRVGGDASDTYGADARLLEFDIHYAIDCPGSDETFSKTAGVHG